VVVVGLGGLITWLVAGARTRATHLLWLSSLFLPSALLYLTNPSITPDQIWAMRRFIPVVVPGLLLATAWVGQQLAARRRVVAGRVVVGRTVGRVLAAALVVVMVAWPVTTLRHMWAEKDKAGALVGNEKVCAKIDHRPTIVTGVDTYLPTVLVLCDVQAVSIPAPSPALLARAYRALGGGSVVLVTRAPGSVPWVDGRQPAQVTFPQKVWEQSIAGIPDEVFDPTMGVSVGLVRPDGSVAAVSP
jgi:hypothetical protein